MKRFATFKEISVGMRVGFTPCGFCGQPHFGRVSAFETEQKAYFADDELRVQAEMFTVLPPIPCVDAELPWAIVPEMVEMGMVWQLDEVN